MEPTSRRAIPGRSPMDERLLIAETIREIQDLLDMLVINARILVPGEMAAQFDRVWRQVNGPDDMMDRVIEDLVINSPKITDTHLQEQGLTGISGKMKRSMLRRSLDAILHHLRPGVEKFVDLLLVNKRQIKAGCEAVAEYLELSKTFFESVCPYAHEVGEFLSFTKQLFTWGAKASEA
jgi:hypothetical protein